jgi:hypothetical protein
VKIAVVHNARRAGVITSLVNRIVDVAPAWHSGAPEAAEPSTAVWQQWWSSRCRTETGDAPD